jgi:HNH endonuclease
MYKKFNSLEERFWSKVKITDGCWLWESYIGTHGYGEFSSKLPEKLAHRVAWHLYKGPLPKGVFLCHHCDVRHCINYHEHLYIGTAQSNMDDCKNRDRQNNKAKVRPGVLHGMSKLTEADVIEIRKLRLEGHLLKSLGVRYGVTQQAIWQVVHNVHWKHLTPPSTQAIIPT